MSKSLGWPLYLFIIIFLISRIGNNFIFENHFKIYESSFIFTRSSPFFQEKAFINPTMVTFTTTSMKKPTAFWLHFTGPTQSGQLK
jgi:hypothetical protein